MAENKSSIYQLNLPSKGEQDWDVPLNENFEGIDQGMACARTHYRSQTIPYAANLTIKPSIGRSMVYIDATDNITSMTLDWSDLGAATKPGDRLLLEVKIHPASGISISWPTIAGWMNGSAPMMNGTKTMRVLFEKSGPNVIGSFMGWEG